MPTRTTPSSAPMCSRSRRGHQKPIGAVHFNLNYVVHHVVHEKPTLTLAQPLLLEFEQ